MASVYMAHLRSSRERTYQATLGFFLYDHPRQDIKKGTHFHIQRHYNGVVDRAKELGYRVETFWKEDVAVGSKRLTEVLRNRGIAGVIVAGHRSGGDGAAKILNWKYFAAASLGFVEVKPRLHSVASHTFRGFNLLCEKAFQLGYRRVAVIVSRHYDKLEDHGVLFAAYYQKHNLEKDNYVDVFTFPTDGPHEMPAIQEWIENYVPDAIIGSKIAWDTLEQMGWRVPQDVAFISMDRAAEYPEIAGFNQRHEWQGVMAVDLVISQLLGNERGIPSIPKLLLVEGGWESGLSAPPKAEIPSVARPVKASLGSPDLLAAPDPQARR